MAITQDVKPAHRETLPTGCPPTSAVFSAEIDVIRLSKVAKPSQQCFMSHAARGLDPGDSDPCTFASCSCFQSGGTDFQSAILKLPRFKKYFSHGHFLKVGPQSGNGSINSKTGHVDVWFFATFDPVAAVYHSEPI